MTWFLYPSGSDTLEVVRVTHSFVERFAILMFIGVVACDTVLHLIGDSKTLDANIHWKMREWNIGSKWGRWRLRLPPYSGRISLKSILKVLSLLWFGASIGLEFAALPYSDRIDELTTSELSDSRRQALSALTFAVNANRGSRQATVSAGDAVRQARDVSNRAKELAEVLRTEQQKLNGMVDALKIEETAAAADAAGLEAEKKKRADLAASLLPRDFFDQSEAMLRMSRLPGQSVIFEFPSEREPRHIAEQIYAVFREINNRLPEWSGARRLVDESSIAEGVRISVGTNISSPPVSVLFVDPKSKRLEYIALAERQGRINNAAAKILLDALHRCGIDAELGDDKASSQIAELPPSTLLITIGAKPNHVLEETLRELSLKPTPVSGFSASSDRWPIPDEVPNASSATKP